MENNESMWNFIQETLGYSDEEMAEFRNNPKSEKLMNGAGKMMATRFTAEVIEAHGCFSGHKAGQKIVLDGAGNLIPDQSPKRMCIYMLYNLAPLIFASQELIYAGSDPANLMFNRCACIDVGRKCGGLGRVVLELKAESAAG